MSWQTRPKCFRTQEQWDAWHEAARAAPPPNRDGYCTDCTPIYQNRMRRRGRCAFPYTTFRITVEGEGVDITGVRYAASK